jgi:hypothetical protein
MRIRCTSWRRSCPTATVRIYRSLVYEKQLALAAFGEAKLIEHPNLFYAVAIVDRGRSQRTRSRAAGQIDAIKTGGVTRRNSAGPSASSRGLHSGTRTIQQKALHLATR